MKLLINYTRSLDGKSSADFSVQKKANLTKTDQGAFIALIIKGNLKFKREKMGYEQRT